MIARTKNQKRVVSLDYYLKKSKLKDWNGRYVYYPVSKIKPIVIRVKKWAKEQVLDNYGIRYRSGTLNCLKCGHHWQSDTKEAWHDEIMEYNCPSCNRELKIESTNKRTHSNEAPFTVVTTIGEYQVIRTFTITGTYKCKQEAKYDIVEGFRLYIRNDGKTEVIGKLRGSMYTSWYGTWRGDMILRNPNSISQKYSDEGKLYPKWKLQDFVIQAGFNAYVNAETTFTVGAVITHALTNSYAETILKDDRIALFDYSIRDNNVKNHWDTMRICIRNQYDIPDPGSYFDMIHALKYFNKDLLNHDFVCPRPFNKAHDFWIDWMDKREQKKKDEQMRIDRIAEIARMKAEKMKYEKRMKKFAKLCFTVGKLEIRPLLKLDDVILAGDLMHHCIYTTTSYWEESDNLLLGCYWKGKLLETAQFKLKQNYLHHCYGVLNEPSKKHGLIMGTIRENKQKIQLAWKPRKKKVKNKSLKQVA